MIQKIDIKKFETKLQDYLDNVEIHLDEDLKLQQKMKLSEMSSLQNEEDSASMTIGINIYNILGSCVIKVTEQKCEDCGFWQRKKHDPGYPMPSPWPGKCMANPVPVSRFENDQACKDFEPSK